jgi:hypothetical protein
MKVRTHCGRCDSFVCSLHSIVLCMSCQKD